MKIRYALLLLTVLLLMPACGSSGSAIIDLNNLEPLPTTTGQDGEALRVAIAAVISPKGTVESYAPLLDYLEKRLNRPVKRVLGSTYAETNEILEAGLADIAFVCTGAYIKGSNEFGMEILVIPEIDNESVYFSWVIVPATSTAEDFQDLEGKVFAYTDPLSLTGWMYPNYLLLNMGEKPETFFSRIFFTYSHDQAIRAVTEGVTDGAAVDSLIYTYLIDREPEMAKLLKVIHKSPAFGMPPVVVNPTIDPQLRAELQRTFLDMSEDPEGKAALSALGIDDFVLAGNELYDSARDVELMITNNAAPLP